jgi:hypothetical protein
MAVSLMLKTHGAHLSVWLMYVLQRHVRQHTHCKAVPVLITQLIASV